MNTNVQLLSKTGKESHPESNCYLAEVIEDEKSKKWHWIRKCKVFVLTSICIGLTFLLLFLPEAIANYNLVTGCYLSDLFHKNRLYLGSYCPNQKSWSVDAIYAYATSSICVSFSTDIFPINWKILEYQSDISKLIVFLLRKHNGAQKNNLKNRGIIPLSVQIYSFSRIYIFTPKVFCKHSIYSYLVWQEPSLVFIKFNFYQGATNIWYNLPLNVSFFVQYTKTQWSQPNILSFELWSKSK